MTELQPGDRVRVTQQGDDGLPTIRYGWVGGQLDAAGPAIVLLDGELKGEAIELDRIELVTVTSLELILSGQDLLEEPALRRGLVGMWRAEAEQAGLELDALERFGDGVPEGNAGYALGEISAGGTSYVLRASTFPGDPQSVHVRADAPPRWPFPS